MGQLGLSGTMIKRKKVIQCNKLGRWDDGTKKKKYLDFNY